MMATGSFAGGVITAVKKAVKKRAAPKTGAAAGGLLSSYDTGGYWCELQGHSHHALAACAELARRLDSFSIAELKKRSNAATREFMTLGVTFTVYSNRDQVDRILPFDVIPRVIPAVEWERLEKGVVQRVAAMNAFLGDIYGPQKAIKDGMIPADLVFGNANYRKEMQDLPVPHGTYIHVCGTDIVRGKDGKFRVLEDNGRTPSGVSYVVENRHLMQRAFPDLVQDLPIRPVSNYGQKLAEALSQIAPAGVSDPQIVLLSPGAFNSAYFEHIFLAREMGVPLVEGRDLVVENDKVFMKTVGGTAPVHVIYRRLNDDFLDPEVFRPDSMLGVAGLMRAYRKGNVALANAVGTGVADDKAIYAYLPRLIRYYLGEDAIIDNVETHICREPEGLKFTLERMDELVVKPVGESGGYGVVIGPRVSKRELAEARDKLTANPSNFISQPMIELSVSPTLCGRAIEPRHVDLRPFAVTGQATWVLPGGLTRVALRKGSLIVNSSQGGGSKDTWVLG
jgi:uncharacterized circularly permuted ATP-grasp superfamily protein